MKYKEWLEQWLAVYIKPMSKAKTYDQYSDIAKCHLMPEFGEYELSEIGPLEVQRYVTRIMERGNLRTGKGLSANTVNSHITVIQSSLEMAFVLGLVKDYTMDKVKRPKPEERKIYPFTTEEQKTIEKAVMSDKRDKMKGIIICLYTGMRIGELMALEWEDIDFLNMKLTVTKTCHDGNDENGNYTRITNDPKTETSNREIPIPKQIMPVLKEMKKKSRSKYVISNGDKMISVRSYQRSFELLLKKLKLPHRGFHSLRHTFATRAISCGMDVKSLSEILGHKSSTVTLKRYVHSFMEVKRDMMNKIGKLF